MLTQLLYGIRTSLLIVFASAAVTTVFGALAGVAVGYLDGIADRLFGFLANVLLAFPTLLLLLALSPAIQSRLVDPGAAEPEWMQFLLLTLVFAAFGWIPLALSLRATVSVRAQVLDLLMEPRERLGVAFLFVSHDLAVVRHFCDRVAVMHRGRLVESADRDRLFAAPHTDYTRELLAAAPEAGSRSPSVAGWDSRSAASRA